MNSSYFLNAFWFITFILVFSMSYFNKSLPNPHKLGNHIFSPKTFIFFLSFTITSKPLLGLISFCKACSMVQETFSSLWRYSWSSTIYQRTLPFPTTLKLSFCDESSDCLCLSLFWNHWQLGLMVCTSTNITLFLFIELVVTSNTAPEVYFYDCLAICISIGILFIYSFCLFFGCTPGIWKFPGQGLHHHKGNAGFLTYCTTVGTPPWAF